MEQFLHLLFFLPPSIPPLAVPSAQVWEEGSISPWLTTWRVILLPCHGYNRGTTTYYVKLSILNFCRGNLGNFPLMSQLFHVRRFQAPCDFSKNISPLLRFFKVPIFASKSFILTLHLYRKYAFFLLLDPKTGEWTKSPLSVRSFTVSKGILLYTASYVLTIHLYR